MKKILLAISLICLLFACGKEQSSDDSNKNEISSPEEIEKARYEEVIKIHDRVMPRMQEIVDMKSKIEEKIGKLETTNPADTFLVTLRTQLVKLDEADQSMMDWMHSFKTDYEGWDHEEILQYLEKEKEKISQSGQLIDQTIKSAEALLKQ